MNIILAIALTAIGLAIAAGGFYVGQTDDAPGAALLGIVLMLAALALAWKALKRKG